MVYVIWLTGISGSGVMLMLTDEIDNSIIISLTTLLLLANLGCLLFSQGPDL